MRYVPTIYHPLQQKQIIISMSVFIKSGPQLAELNKMFILRSVV